nr:NAD(P)/FAD-dependent oxidoreductase [Thermus neutrinimicus]
MEPQVVVVGGGFAGLAAARVLAQFGIPYLLVDARNHHLFQPLLYQVATGFLEAPAVAHPLRSLLKGGRFLLAQVEAVDLKKRHLLLTGGVKCPYQYLVVATGSKPHHLGVPGVTAHTYPLKTLEDALRIRYALLSCLEEAAHKRVPFRVLVVGGGPTGVELAGALAEFLRHVLPRDYPEVPGARVTLLEAGERLLPSFNLGLSRYALRALEHLGVEVRLEAKVAHVSAGWVRLQGGDFVAGDLILWAVGVKGKAPLGLPVDPKGRVPTDPFLRLPGHPEVYVVGDLNGLPWPQLAPVALQQGRHAALNLVRAMQGKEPLPFHYRDRGQLAVIGRHRAVAQMGRLGFYGLPAWLLWALVHLAGLVGFRNRLLVLLDWAYTYFFREPGVRILLQGLAPGGPLHENSLILPVPPRNGPEEPS